MPPHFDDHRLAIYQDAARYNAENWWKIDDMTFWRGLAGEFGPRVLELASGTGRLAPQILQAGADYTGLDASEAFLQHARNYLSEYGDGVRLIHRDMREFDLGETFDLILVGFNSFLHLLTDDEALAALACVRKHCHPGARFAMDIFVPDPLFLYRPEDQRIPAKIYTDPDTGAKVTVQETNRYDPETELNRLRWYYSTAEDQDFLVHDFTLRMFFPDTMDSLLHAAGFRVLEKWGDYGRNPFNAHSSLQLYIAEPAG